LVSRADNQTFASFATEDLRCGSSGLRTTRFGHLPAASSGGSMSEPIVLGISGLVLVTIAGLRFFVLNQEHRGRAPVGTCQ